MAKFHRLAGRFYPEERQAELVERIGRLEQLPNMAAFLIL